MDYFQSEIRAGDQDLKDFHDDLERVPLYNQAKNDRLYVGLTEAGFARPSTRFDRAEAEALVRLARARLKVFDIPLPHSRDELAEFLDSPAGAVTRLFYSGEAERLLKNDEKRS